VMPWAEAIRRMTSLAAANVGLRGRGRVAPGLAADLVLLDTAAVVDRATPTEPRAVSDGIRAVWVSAGIRAVWVNGALVYRDGSPTGAHPGRVLRRSDSTRAP
jgi:N-acyl-D-amino-acid deacylase